MSYMNVGFTTCLHYVYNMTLVICNMEALVKSLVLHSITDVLFTCIQMYCILPFEKVIFILYFCILPSYLYFSAFIPDIMLNICMIFYVHWLNLPYFCAWAKFISLPVWKSWWTFIHEVVELYCRTNNFHNMTFSLIPHYGQFGSKN